MISRAPRANDAEHARHGGMASDDGHFTSIEIPERPFCARADQLRIDRACRRFALLHRNLSHAWQQPSVRLFEMYKVADDADFRMSWNREVRVYHDAVLPYWL